MRKFCSVPGGSPLALVVRVLSLFKLLPSNSLHIHRSSTFFFRRRCVRRISHSKGIDSHCKCLVSVDVNMNWSIRLIYWYQGNVTRRKDIHGSIYFQSRPLHSTCRWTTRPWCDKTSGWFWFWPAVRKLRHKYMLKGCSSMSILPRRRACPGKHMALSATWIAVASILSVFNISKALDADGDIIEPSMEYDSSTLQKWGIITRIIELQWPYSWQPSTPIQVFNQITVPWTPPCNANGRWLCWG